MSNKYNILNNQYKRLDDFRENPASLGMEGSGTISIETIDYVKHFLKLLVDNNIPLPGVFPILDSEDSGVLLEWANSERVLSVSFLDTSNYECFILGLGATEGLHMEGNFGDPFDEAKIIFFIMKNI